MKVVDGDLNHRVDGSHICGHGGDDGVLNRMRVELVCPLDTIVVIGGEDGPPWPSGKPTNIVIGSDVVEAFLQEGVQLLPPSLADLYNLRDFCKVCASFSVNPKEICHFRG